MFFVGFPNSMGEVWPNLHERYTFNLHCFQSKGSSARLMRWPCVVCHYTSNAVNAKAPLPKALGCRFNRSSYAFISPECTWVLAHTTACGSFVWAVTHTVIIQFSKIREGSFRKTFISLYTPSRIPYRWIPIFQKFLYIFFKTLRMRSRLLINALWLMPLKLAHSRVDIPLK